MASKTALSFISISNNFIFADLTKEKFRVNKKDFTRSRKLPFKAVVLCMLKLLRKSLPIELNSFLKDLNSNIKKVTSSAFIQSRKKIKPDLFYELNTLVAKEYYSDNDENVKLYKGLRVLSVDGSTINLPVTQELKQLYGTHNNQNKTEDVVVGRISVLYDVLNEIVMDGYLRSFSEGEASLSREHFNYLQKGDLVIMDRAYPSFESAYRLQEQGVEFIFRCSQSFSNQTKQFYESGKKEDIIEIQAKQNKSFDGLPYNAESKITARMIRIVLDSGEVEILMTSLLDTKMYLHKEFKALYFKRWKIETFYDRFKNIIGVEKFSGTSNQFIQQEFNCALYISNMQTILTQQAQNEAAIKYEHREYEYKINHSLSLGFIREKLVQLYSVKKDAQKILNELKELFILNVIPIRIGRTNIRDTGKYRRRTKPKQFKNRRAVF